MKKQNDDDVGGNGNDTLDETIEDALALLKQGTEFEKESKFWEASDKFLQGRRVLQTLANNQSQVTTEDQQIVSLYEEKSQEYLRQSRISLVEAMRLEMEPDDEKSPDFYENLTDEEAQLRIRIFYTLFSKKVEMEEPDKNISEQQWSIEERLQELNASLPSGFKTDDERMDSINRGLNRLGLSLYTQKKPFARFQETLPKSEEDQIEDIMAQAKDEVALEKNFGGDDPGFSAKNAGAEDADFGDDDDSEEDTDDDLKLDDDQLAIKHIRRRVVKAQTKLAELVASLDEAKIAKDEEEKYANGYDGSDDSIAKPSGDSYLASGKKKLRTAQRDLQKAMEEWTEALL